MRLIRPIFLLLAILTSPARAYWQQHVSYDIHVTLIDSIHTLDGSLLVVYTNNSPDTLREVFFHLYSNAFQPGSMMDERALAIHTAPVYDRIHKLPESEWGKYWINNVSVDGATSPFEITGTIMHVVLSKPLAPGDSTRIVFQFREQIPRQIRRSGWMSREGVEYSMSQWYPKICEYDAEGWQKQEYVSREFYGVWGDFRVEITLPSRFTVGATGECVNATEVGHGYDQIAAGMKEGLVEPNASSGMTTWKFHASPVHDFAWVADDDYIHEWMTWQDTITIHSFYKSWSRPYWEKNALAYSLFALSTYSHHYGPYAYRNFSCTMAGDGGMEYPQLIMITGYRPNPLSLAGVIAHEVGHQWFYGMLGSNETREAFMDEGFTTYATTMCMNALFGDNQEYPGEQHSWLDWFIPKFSNKRDNYRGYQEMASQGYEEPLDIPHDWFREDATAGQVYGKTAAILNMLEYTLGDSTFAVGMKEYYNEWRFKHPHLLDFKRVMEKVAHTDLDWFFDEWFKTTRTLDYEAQSVRSAYVPGDMDPGFSVNWIKLKNNGLAVMPIDLLLHFDDGSSASATIPLATNKGLSYRKPSDERNRIYLPPWDWTSPTYQASFSHYADSRRLSWFEIDTSWRLQDLNWLNNYSDRAGLWMLPSEWAVWKQLFVNPPIDKYWAVARPIVWYDQVSKLNLGLGTKFGMNLGFTGDAKLIYKTAPSTLNPAWYDYVDGSLRCSQPVDWLGRLTSFGIDAEKMDGISEEKMSVTKEFRPEYWRLGADHSATLYLEADQLVDSSYPVYHHASTGWPHRSTEIAGFTYSVRSEDRRDRFELDAETSILQSEAHYNRLKATMGLDMPEIESITSHLRFTAGSTSENSPRLFHLGRAGTHAEQASGFFRAASDINSGADKKMSLFLEGGSGVRGYNAGGFDITGTQMAGVSYDVKLPNPVANLWSPLASLSPGAFTDAGWVGEDWGNSLRDIRTDAGIKIDVNILSWLPYQLRGVAEEYDPIPIVAFNIPLYENHPADGKPNFAWRWAISVGTVF